VARGTFVEVADLKQPAPAPRFSRTPADVPTPPAHAGQHTDDVLASAGFDADQIAKLRASGAVA
jgi:alpha-methylacyl-CoA racemase